MKRPRTSIVCLLGGLVAWPWVYLISFMCLIIPVVLVGDILEFDIDPFPLILPLHLATILITWILVAYFIIYVWKSDYVARDKRALWTATLVFGNMFSIPVFWYYYILRVKQEDGQNYNHAMHANPKSRSADSGG